MQSEKIFNVDEAAEKLRCHPTTLRGMIRRGEAPKHFKVGREARFTETALKEFMGV